MVLDLWKNSVEVRVFFLWCTRAPKLYSRYTKYYAPKFQILRALQVKITLRSSTFLCRRISFLSRLISKNVYNSHLYQVEDITQDKIHFYSSQLSNNILCEIFTLFKTCLTWYFKWQRKSRKGKHMKSKDIFSARTAECIHCIIKYLNHQKGASWDKIIVSLSISKIWYLEVQFFSCFISRISSNDIK